MQPHDPDDPAFDVPAFDDPAMDDLALSAFDDTDRRDLDPEAAAALTAYRRALDIARTTTDHDLARDDAPPDLWNAIAGAAFAEQHPPDIGTAPPPFTEPAPAPVVELAPRRRVSTLVLLASAAVVVAVALIGLAVRGGNDETPTIVARADLSLVAGDQGVPGATGSGEAELLRSDAGEELVVDTSGMTPLAPGQFYELWLLNTDGSPVDPRSLTTMEIADGQARAVVPPAIDTQKWTVVDISVQSPDDAPHQHSGHSLLRGDLQPT